MVHEDLKPSDIMTRGAFENAIVVNSAIGGSTNAPFHLNAVAAHMGVPLDNEDWQNLGHDVPLIVGMQPSGYYLAEDFHLAGGVADIRARPTDMLENGGFDFPPDHPLARDTTFTDRAVR